MSGQGYSADGVRRQYTGFERDAETGLDFAQARYYSDQQGRFSSPDPFAGSMKAGDPQSFNRYSYVGNNPINGTDPSGMLMTTPDGAVGGFMPGDSGAMGRSMPGVGSDMGSDGGWVSPTAVAEAVAAAQAQAAAAVAGAAGSAAGLALAQAASSVPQDTLEEDNPPSIQQNGPGCSISVSFAGPSWFGNENGPSSDGRYYGLGFTVSGFVTSGGIGGINDEPNPENPKGQWTIQQWAAVYAQGNNIKPENDQRARLDPIYPGNRSIFGNNFIWVDHPGPVEFNIRSHFSKWNFAVKAMNGKDQCEIKFHVLMNFSRDRGLSIKWGGGNY